ncbi:MAG: DUF547 domain-containing protein [Pseudomonadota bacterium]
MAAARPFFVADPPSLLARIATALFVVAAGALFSGFSSLERFAAPSSKLSDRHWLQSGSARFDDNAAYQDFLDTYLRTDRNGVNRVAYGRVSAADRKRLDAYIDSLAAQKVTALARADQLALWINLYNAKTIAIILDNYPVSSIRDIRSGTFSAGPWNRKVVTVEGRSLSLNDIEHGIIRPVFKDPKIHYVINCAAVGCPNLGKKAYSGATLSKAMDRAARTFINSPHGVSVAADGSVTLSKIFNWFRADFGRSEADVLKHVASYADPQVRAALAAPQSVTYKYDWALNSRAGGSGS